MARRPKNKSIMSEDAMLEEIREEIMSEEIMSEEIMFDCVENVEIIGNPSDTDILYLYQKETGSFYDPGYSVPAVAVQMVEIDGETYLKQIQLENQPNRDLRELIDPADQDKPFFCILREARKTEESRIFPVLIGEDSKAKQMLAPAAYVINQRGAVPGLEGQKLVWSLVPHDGPKKRGRKPKS